MQRQPGGLIEEALPALDGIVGTVRLLRDQLDLGEAGGSSTERASDRLDEVVERLYSVIEELQISNEELRTALMDLQHERSRYRDLFHSAPEAHLLTDEHGVVLDANRPAETLVGCAPRALIGCSLLDLVAPGGRRDASVDLRQARSGVRGEAIWTLRRLDGGTRLARVAYLPVEEGSGGFGAQWLMVDLEQPLFESEDRAAASADVARRWLSVYGELTAATESLVRASEEGAAQLEQPARAEFEEAQVRPLDARLVRLRQGLEHWRRRHAELVHLEFDLAASDVAHGGRTVRMTRRERQLLHILLAHPGRWFTASALMVQAWHSSYLAEEQLRTYIVRLRRKLDDLGAPCQVVSQRGRGYALQFSEGGEPPTAAAAGE